MITGDAPLPDQSAQLGEAVREARKRLLMSQRDVAEESGVSLRTFREIEKGRVRRPRLRSLQRLAVTLQEPLLVAHGLGRPSPDSAAHQGRHGLFITVLGPLNVWSGHVPVNTGTPMQQSLLGLLAVHANARVSQAEIADVLWRGDPPASFNQLIHTYVSRLRALLAQHQAAPARSPLIVRRSSGYELQADEDQLDLLHFRELTRDAERARATGDLELEVELLTESLRLWSGPVLDGSAARLHEHPIAVECGQRRIASALRFAQLAIASGRHQKVIDQLRPMLRQHPLHEGLHAQLMLALAGTGQQVQALKLFDALNQTMRNDYGIEPGTELRAVHLSVLRGAASASGRAHKADAAPRAEAGRRYELPPDLADFVGRDEHQPVLLHLTQGSSLSGAFTPSPVASIYGPPGVGKSALAIRVANSSRVHFTDSALYVDMRDSRGGAADPHSALGRCLHALGVREADIPKEFQERVSSYRSLLAERRVLVVVDNVSREEQIGPLVPSGFNSGLLFTSTARLFGVPGARNFALGSFTMEQSLDLLARMIGTERVLAEREAAESIAELSDSLPLAVRIMGERLARRPHWPLARIVRRLHDERHRLSEFVHGQLDLPARLGAGFATLEAPFRYDLVHLAHTCPGPFTASYAAASLGIDPSSAEERLDTLGDQQLLLGPDEQGRYDIPMFTRLYALTIALRQTSGTAG